MPLTIFWPRLSFLRQLLLHRLDILQVNLQHLLHLQQLRRLHPHLQRLLVLLRLNMGQITGQKNPFRDRLNFEKYQNFHFKPKMKVLEFLGFSLGNPGNGDQTEISGVKREFWNSRRLTFRFWFRRWWSIFPFPNCHFSAIFWRIQIQKLINWRKIRSPKIHFWQKSILLTKISISRWENFFVQFHQKFWNFNIFDLELIPKSLPLSLSRAEKNSLNWPR